jgi:hypothetical protein
MMRYHRFFNSCIPCSAGFSFGRLGARHVVTNFILAYSVHESCSLGRVCTDAPSKVSLSGTPKSLMNCVNASANAVSIDLLQGIWRFEATFVCKQLCSNIASQRLYLTICCVSGELAVYPFDAKHSLCSVLSTDGKNRGIKLHIVS